MCQQLLFLVGVLLALGYYGLTWSAARAVAVIVIVWYLWRSGTLGVAPYTPSGKTTVIPTQWTSPLPPDVEEYTTKTDLQPGRVAKVIPNNS